MKKIEFNMDEKDIQRYLANHKDFVLNKEALFVKYVKEEKELSFEVLNMLTMKYNCVDLQSDFDWIEEDEILSYTFPSFGDYLKKQKLDMEGICHIIIPAIGLYSSNKEIFSVRITPNIISIVLQMGAKTIGIKKDFLSTVIENYTIAGQMQTIENFETQWTYIMGRKKCRDILLEYENIYGQENVRKVRKLVREREW